MSASDQDMSDSNLESPFSQSDSPYSSPSHQVPQLANFISELSCAENANVLRNNGPYLCIVEQPQNHFRFRYKSEMIGTHGCLLGRSHSTNKSKTHPTVELRNYSGKALIRCRLARHICDDEHPHKLLEDDQDRDVHSWLPEKGSYRVAFRGMGIIHTAKKDVASLLYKKYSLERPESTFDENKLRLRCENEAKNINLNIVRLKFSAHDPHTEAEICPPVFSEWIQNMKSAATNDLKICRISRCVGRPKGNEDVFIFVEKVNKKNIMINFFELDQYGERRWSKKGNFIQSDVHHQYAIAFRTPSYEDIKITSDVKVFIELVRPSDGRTSEPKEFTYKAEPIYRHNKKRKANSAFSSIESGSGSSIKSFSDLPTTVEDANQQFNNMNNIDMDISKHNPEYIKVPQHQIAPTDDAMIGDALFHSCVGPNIMEQKIISPLLSQPNVPGPPVLQLHSSELERVLNASEEKKQFWSTDFGEYFDNLDSTINEPGQMEWIKASMMVSDSGRQNEKYKKTNEALKVEIKEESKINIKKKIPSEYTAFYKSEDGIEVKKLVKELCEMIRNKSGYKKQVVKNKLERLFEMRLSNGDTFLHMTLSSNQPSLEYIVKLIHNMKMTKLLNLKNNLMQTILHLAIINDSPDLVSFLVSKGCNPMEEDDEGNNALHYAVICQTCLGPLLDSIKSNNVSFDINAYNNEKQTALHLSSVYGCAVSASRLLRAGADAGARDGDGRTALHLAVYDDCQPAARALLQQCDVDAVDSKGYTALQIACDSEIRENTREIVKLLLENKADPTKHEDNTSPAWKLARDKPQIAELIQKYITPQMIIDDDIKSEPEDEFDSAEEGEPEPDLTALQIYIDRVAALLDNNGGWVQLMKKVQKESYHSWYSATKSPTRTLLYNLKETEEISSKSLALMLEDIGQFEAANIIKACISEYY